MRAPCRWRILPAVGDNWPANTLSNDDFPEPFGPVTTSRSPPHTSNEIGCGSRSATDTASADNSIVLLLASDGKLKDRKSTRLNSSHVSISYAVFCLKKKRKRK